MIRFIHAADIHLDSPMRGIESENARIDSDVYRRSTRLALSNLIDFAIREKVDFMTLGGDNFDGDLDSWESGYYFNEQMARLGDIPVVSISGNHDAESKMTKNLNYPRNFKQLSVDEVEVYPVIDGVQVIGRGFRNPQEKNNLVVDYPYIDGKVIKIGLLHTSLDGKDGHARYAPCTIEDLRVKNYHFWGLGHIHKHSWELPAGELPILFPGNLQGRHIRETGPKGAWLIELDDDGRLLNAKFEAMDVTRWEMIRIDTSQLLHIDDLWRQCEMEFVRKLKDAGDRPLAVRLRLDGSTDLHDELLQLQFADNRIHAEIQSMASNIASKRIWVEKVELKTSPPVTSSVRDSELTHLHQFIEEKAVTTEWMTQFLEMDDIKKLKSQLGYFDNPEDKRELEAIFKPESIAALIEQVPEFLKSYLSQTNYGKTERIENGE